MVRLSGLQVSCGVCSVPLFLPFVPFLLCLWWVDCKYAPISHFKGVFSGFWGADVYLYGLRSLRGLWGFCVRVRLGGFGACCVFAFVFLLLSLCLLSFYALCLSSGALPLLSSACPLARLVCSCVLVGLCFLFPFGYSATAGITKLL